MDANYVPINPRIETKSVELKLQAFSQRIPREWCVSVHRDYILDDMIITLERLIADLDCPESEYKFEYVDYTHPVYVPKEPIDYLRCCLVKMFPLLTAPLWQPQYKLQREYGTTVAKIKTSPINKVVAAPSTRRFQYYGR